MSLISRLHTVPGNLCTFKAPVPTFFFDGLGGQRISLYKFNDPVPMLLLVFCRMVLMARLIPFHKHKLRIVDATTNLGRIILGRLLCSRIRNVLLVCCWFSFLFPGRFQIQYRKHKLCTKDGFQGLSEVYSHAHTTNISHIVPGNLYNCVQKTRFRFVF